MDKAHRKVILERLIPLVQSIFEFERVLDKSLELQLFTQPMILDIKDVNVSSHEQKKNFFLNTRTRGPEAFSKLINVLQSTNHILTVEILTAPEDFFDSASQSHARRSPNWQFSESYADKPIGVVRVQKAKYINGADPFQNNIYKMTSKPRGFALIIVNKTFTDQSLYRTRDCADEDLRLIRELFSQLGYDTSSYYTDVKRNAVDPIVDNFIQKFKTQDVDSCVVAISSHGERNGFVCVDDEIFETELLITKFNNVNCGILRGKPKMFFIQACRGDETNDGVPFIIDASDAKPENKSPNVNITSSYLPNTTDIYVLYAVQLGYRAYNNQLLGSWFFSTITKVFAEYARQMEFLHLLAEVNEHICRLKTWAGEKQGTEFRNLMWRKKLYFNPGL